MDMACLTDDEWDVLGVCVNCRLQYQIIGDELKPSRSCCLCGLRETVTDIPKQFRARIADLAQRVLQAKCLKCHVMLHGNTPNDDSLSAVGSCANCGAVGQRWLAPSRSASEKPSEEKSKSSYQVLCEVCRSKSPFQSPDDRLSRANHCESCGALGNNVDLFMVITPAKIAVKSKTADTTAMNNEDLRSIFSAAGQASKLADESLKRLHALRDAYRVIHGGDCRILGYAITDLAAAKSQSDYILSKKPKI